MSCRTAAYLGGPSGPDYIESPVINLLPDYAGGFALRSACGAAGPDVAGFGREKACPLCKGRDSRGSCAHQGAIVAGQEWSLAVRVVSHGCAGPICLGSMPLTPINVEYKREAFE
jgi:hypothetical protein